MLMVWAEELDASFSPDGKVFSLACVKQSRCSAWSSVLECADLGDIHSCCIDGGSRLVFVSSSVTLPFFIHMEDSTGVG